MNQLLLKTSILMSKVNIPWAICGGFALDLFLERDIRKHSDIDICVFEKDREKIFQYMLQNNWDVYEFRGQGKLRLLDTASISEEGHNLMCIRGKCELVNFYPCDEKSFLYHEFIHTGIKEFNYLEFLFNTSDEDYLVFDKSRGIKRELAKAILFKVGIPFLAPEIVLLYKSSKSDNTEYDYDFRQTYPYMDDEQKKWFSQNIDVIYPNGHSWKI